MDVDAVLGYAKLVNWLPESGSTLARERHFEFNWINFSLLIYDCCSTGEERVCKYSLGASRSWIRLVS